MGQEQSAPCEVRHRAPGQQAAASPCGTRASHKSRSDRSSSGGDSRYGDCRYSRHPACRDQPRRSKGSISSDSAVSRSDSDASGRNQRLPIYTNVHYRDVNNNDIYKPLKIGKNKIHRLKILDADKDTAIYLEKHLSIKSYLDKEEAIRIKDGTPLPEPTTKKSGIRNYTPKILSEKKMQKDLEHWI